MTDARIVVQFLRDAGVLLQWTWHPEPE